MSTIPKQNILYTTSCILNSNFKKHSLKFSLSIISPPSWIYNSALQIIPLVVTLFPSKKFNFTLTIYNLIISCSHLIPQSEHTDMMTYPCNLLSLLCAAHNSRNHAYCSQNRDLTCLHSFPHQGISPSKQNAHKSCYSLRIINAFLTTSK